MILLVLLELCLALRNQPRLGPLAWSCLHLVILQIGIGALNVVTRLPVEVTALHSGFAAALVLLTSLLVREALLGQRGRTPGLRAGALEVG